MLEKTRDDADEEEEDEDEEEEEEPGEAGEDCLFGVVSGDESSGSMAMAVIVVRVGEEEDRILWFRDNMKLEECLEGDRETQIRF